MDTGGIYGPPDEVVVDPRIRYVCVFPAHVPDDVAVPVEWYWHRVASIGNLPDEIVADGAQGYDSEGACLAAARRENPGYQLKRNKSGHNH